MTQLPDIKCFPDALECGTETLNVSQPISVSKGANMSQWKHLK
jgi:hypothetical protein